MNFELDEDQGIFLGFVDRLVARHRQAWQPTGDRHAYRTALAGELADSGFLDAATEQALGPLAACLMVMALADLSDSVEVGASALLAPLLGLEVRGPLAVLWGDAARPARFLPQARHVVQVQGRQVRLASLQAGDVTPCESVFAYPMGLLRQPAALAWRALPGVDADAVCARARLAAASEIVGCLRAGLASVVEHVTQRQQFGRPIGSFQGVQHRLAAAASQIEGLRWMTLRAAWSGRTVDGLAALGQGQAISTRIGYDLHQFMGAMGLTLEHPLHRWTYRLRLLRSELGGADAQLAELAAQTWSPSAASALPAAA